MEAGDKEWAQKYILDPLTAPEPSEETGPGTSHFSQLRGSLAYTNPASTSASQSGSQSRHNHRSSSGGQRNKSKALEEASVASSRSTPGYPTPPGSASPTRNSFHSSNPFSSPRTSVRDAPPPYTPSGEPSSSPRPRHSNQPSISLTPPRSEPRHRSSSTGHLPGSAPPRHTRDRSLSGRFPGDMSHRPLDVLKREARVADKPQHRRRRHGGSTDTDVIDSLDTIGGAYHHGGPYDATLASHNINQTYSPVAAVHDSNMEALKATPREYVQDSLRRHMPLQGTATVPSGTVDMSGRVMDYQEGADLMREADAPGGAYKRWDGIQYHPEDYKGKGEPSYTYERDAKERKHGKDVHRNEIEMQGLLYPTRRQRSHSNGAAASSGNAFGDDADGLQRSNTTGNRISSGLKKRFGSIRRKKTPQEEGATA